jgi:GntR family transcriptional regulator
MTTHGALPAYLQIAELLTRDIGAGRLTHGQRLPPERAMALDHGVSVTTLRKALAELAARDLLDRRQGSGNYIQSGAQATGIYALFRLELPGGGGLPTATVLDRAIVPKPADMPIIGSSHDGLRIRRLRALSGTPVSVEENWLDAIHSARLTGPLSDSLYLAYRQRLNLWITRAEDRVGLAPAPDWVPDSLGLPTGTAAVLVERISFDKTGTAAEYSRTWFHPDRARYVARLP